ncbi:hypothetical protein GN958_ATG20238 [Phytophthora infestans]|uniref:Uncharacterized protein n=1 Tax=Phytophthora infestans TaxID=4787 RepID=A0A8S9TSS9_PHYIN|nr:hypothetical protein GN958_ATG20238 [Phytophthora infestans]
MVEEDVALVGVDDQEITKADDQVDEVHDSEATGGKDGTLGKHQGRMLLSGVQERSAFTVVRATTGGEDVPCDSLIYRLAVRSQLLHPHSQKTSQKVVRPRRRSRRTNSHFWETPSSRRGGDSTAEDEAAPQWRERDR